MQGNGREGDEAHGEVTADVTVVAPHKSAQISGAMCKKLLESFGGGGGLVPNRFQQAVLILNSAGGLLIPRPRDQLRPAFKSRLCYSKLRSINA